MPDVSENTENEQTQESQQLPEKLRGKSAGEIAQMYSELEERLGVQGRELGELREWANNVYSQLKAGQTWPAEAQDEAEEDAPRWERLGDELITNPGKILPRVVDEAVERASRKAADAATAQINAQRKLDTFFRSNPDLDEYREIVAVIGERLYQAYGGRESLDAILDRTAKEARTYIGSLRDRLSGRRKADEERRRNAMTTGGGGRAREAIRDDEEEHESRERVSEEKAAILDEIKSLRDFRTPRMDPPHARRGKAT